MNSFPCSSLLLLLLFTVAQAQQKPPENTQPPPNPKFPTVTCSDAQTVKACTSFKQLLEAKDKETLESISSSTSYVCFRPNEDAFLIFHVNAPRDNLWETLEAGGEKQFAPQFLAEFRNGVLYNNTLAFGNWNRYSFGKEVTEPTFTSRSDEGHDDGAIVIIDAGEIAIEYPFKNQNSGTTQYSLTIRRSTGRFIETFSVENTPSTTHSGTCLIYR